MVKLSEVVFSVIFDSVPKNSVITLTCRMYFKHAIPVNSYKVTVESFLLECNFVGN